MNRATGRLIIFSCAAVIMYLSLSSGELQKWGSFAYLDKVQHLMAYSSFAFIACCCIRHRRQRWMAAVGILLFSAVIEWLQGYVGRETSWLDLLANATGILTGLLSYRIWHLYRPKLVKSLYSFR